MTMAYITGETLTRELKLQNDLKQVNKDIGTLIKYIDTLEHENARLKAQLVGGIV